ncbi:hypothetical protein GCM10009754_03740 [Amycolatopsis minnesotensis]|uniref:Uncharacterized protein n=1 Tax=Amycolatopsis minnesotensis TaxID=337894 RepID=A0ABN2PZR3_9PSEU
MGRAQYSIFDAADPRKLAFRERTNHWHRTGSGRGRRRSDVPETVAVQEEQAALPS